MLVAILCSAFFTFLTRGSFPAGNDPRVKKVKKAEHKIATSTLEINVSKPLVADAADLPVKDVNRASNDPRAKRTS